MNTRIGLKRCDTRWPQTLQMSRRAMRTPNHAYRRKLIDLRDPFEVSGAIAGLIGIAVLTGIVAGWL